jgi:hypothetical protein
MHQQFSSEDNAKKASTWSANWCRLTFVDELLWHAAIDEVLELEGELIEGLEEYPATHLLIPLSRRPTHHHAFWKSRVFLYSREKVV